MITTRVGASRRWLVVFLSLLGAYALLAVLYYLLTPLDQLAPYPGTAGPTTSLPSWLLGVAIGGFILAIYGPLGLAGCWLAHRLGLPGVFREKAGRQALLLVPGLLGAGVGVAVAILDRVFALTDPSWPGFSHPPFPVSIAASAAAGIGEEILFRLFVLSLWAFLLNLVLGRVGASRVALWLGNVIAALAFGASHLPAAMLLVGASSPAEIPALVLGELFLLNGLLGVVAGWQYLRNGLVAAIGIHFWADFVWHVIWPLLQGL